MSGMTKTLEHAAPVEAAAVHKVAFSSFIGTFIEFYDYFIYGASAALVFPRLFFSNLSPSLGSILAFATLGIPFLTRPLGAIVFGHYGDTVGRKKMLVIALMIMGLATFSIGLLPTYRQIGIAAPILLVLARLLQGVAVGGEWGGATTMIVEYAPANRRGLYGTFVQVGNAVGLLCSVGAFAAASSLSPERFFSWGWRLPFLASIVLLAVGAFIRMRIPEPPVFQQLIAANRQLKHPVMEVLRRHRKAIALIAGMRASENVIGYLIISWIMSYATNRLGMPRGVILSGVMVAAATGAVSSPLFGMLSDRIGRRPVFLGGAIAACLFAFPFFWLIDTRSVTLLFIALAIGYGGVLASMYSLEPSYFSELFDTNIRYSGISIGYQFASVLGGFTPMIAASLMAWSGGSSRPVAIFLLIASLVTAICTWLAGEPSRGTQAH